MNILSYPRASGKTTECLRWAVKNNGLVVVPNTAFRQHVLHLAQHQYPHVDASWWEAHIVTAEAFARRPDRTDPYVIDELDTVLAMLFRRTPEFVTRTPA